MQWIRDGVGSAAYADDIDNQSPTGNYGYDSIGNMIRDDQGGITSIEWTVYGKIKKISKSSGQTISYGYDAAGNRISKTVTTNNQTTYTWYVRDAQGNTMSTYSSSGTGTSMPATLSQTEVHLYGSSRLGVMNRNLDAKQPLSTPDSTTMQRGWKFFELSNHLGNVLATVSDKKLGHTPDGTNIDYYSADVMTVSDYYPFGMLMPGRQFGQGVNIPGVSTTGNTPVNGYSVPADMTVTTRSSSEPTQYVAANTIEFTGSFESLSGDEMEAYIADGSYAGTGNVMGGVSGGAGKYRYGFNGKEQDPEVSGTGNQYDYGFRIYNPRIGRFLSVDPLTKSYPWYTPYQFAGNKPIIAVDLDGLEEKVVVNEYYDGNLVKTQTLYYKDIMARLPVIPAEIDIIPGQGIVNIDRRRFSGMGIIGENNYDDYTYQPDPNRLVVSTTRVYTNSVVQALTKQSKWVQENINTAGYGVDASVSAKADINGTATSGEAKLNFQALAYQNQAGKVKLNENVSLSVAANGTSTSKDKNIIANSSLSLNAKSEVFGYFFLKSGTKDIVAEGFTPESTTSFKLSNLKVEYTRSASGNMTFKLGLTDQPGFELKTSLLKEKAVLQSNTSTRKL
ncbi:MAG: RHS repeat-associated core domain-containing protein [Bacteroidetes bacterium]|nr:RHS repeat-associated core domain-containing protein [Bacteroidota bacterium]